ncbi:MAG: hypothetical protein V3U31_03475 [Dehalococcoidia bacterium]
MWRVYSHSHHTRCYGDHADTDWHASDDTAARRDGHAHPHAHAHSNANARRCTHAHSHLHS